MAKAVKHNYKMIDKKSINLAEKKQQILEIIKKEGPCLPSSVANKIGIPLLLTSAFFSEMKAEKMLKISNLKIGGSPLYYVEGQEAQLENFIKYLELKEQEAFELLKKAKVLDETTLEPAHRVAFRNMKDFAYPINVKTENDEKTFWCFYTIKQEDASKKIYELLKKEKVEKKEAEKKEEKEAEKKEEKKLEEKKLEKGKARKRVRENVKLKVKSWLDAKKFAVEQELDDDFIVSIDSEIGKLSFLIVPRLKKTINEADLSLAYQQGQDAKMPVLLLTNGKLSKKAQAYLEKLGRLIVVEKI